MDTCQPCQESKTNSSWFDCISRNKWYILLSILVIIIIIIIVVLATLDKDQFNVKFGIYTKKNEKEPQNITDSLSVRNSNFNAANPTRFLIHGWHEDIQSPFVTNTVKAYLNKGDYNVFVVDWNKLARRRYEAARIYLRIIVHKVVKLIKILRENHKLSLENTYLIGNGLGGHLAGLVGRHFRKSKIRQIIGLDPPRKGYRVFPRAGIHSRDAEYVEIIHTSADSGGLKRAVASGDFYPNWGGPQPDCKSIESTKCSHDKAADYFVKTLSSSEGFKVFKCKNFKAILKKEKSRCEEAKNVTMGGDEPKGDKHKGVFLVNVAGNATAGGSEGAGGSGGAGGAGGDKNKKPKVVKDEGETPPENAPAPESPPADAPPSTDDIPAEGPGRRRLKTTSENVDKPPVEYAEKYFYD